MGNPAYFELKVVIMLFKEFDKIDWSSYAGAEEFSDGSSPLISYQYEIVFIIDNVGVFIEESFEKSEFPFGFRLENQISKQEKQQICEVIFQRIAGQPSETIIEILTQENWIQTN